MLILTVVVVSCLHMCQRTYAHGTLNMCGLVFINSTSIKSAGRTEGQGD